METACTVNRCWLVLLHNWAQGFQRSIIFFLCSKERNDSLWQCITEAPDQTERICSILWVPYSALSMDLPQGWESATYSSKLPLWHMLDSFRAPATQRLGPFMGAHLYTASHGAQLLGGCPINRALQEPTGDLLFQAHLPADQVWLAPYTEPSSSAPPCHHFRILSRHQCFKSQGK